MGPFYPGSLDIVERYWENKAKADTVSETKIDTLPENILINMFSNHKMLAGQNQELYQLASHSHLNYLEFSRIVQTALGGSLTAHEVKQLDWDYLAHFWWDEMENDRELCECHQCAPSYFCGGCL